MERSERRGGRGLTQKRDTPVKPALGRRQKHRRLLPIKQYEALPEEPEAQDVIVPTVKPISAVWKTLKPVRCESAMLLNSPADTESSRNRAISPSKKRRQVSPAGDTQATPDSKALYGGETSLKEEEPNLTLTAESMESDMVFSSDDDGDNFYSSASSSSSSLPSPEIFRREEFVETVISPIKQELLGLHPNIKNSTLLDVSCAQSIHMHQPPNLSTIIDASTILAEMCETRGPEAETKIQTHSFKSDKASAKVRQSPGYLLHIIINTIHTCLFLVESKVREFDHGQIFKLLLQLTQKRSILCKKKVLFKSPIFSEIMEAKHTSAPKCTTDFSSPLVQTSSPAEQMKPDSESFRVGEMHSKDTTSHMRVTLKGPVETSPEKAKFFDFIDSERDVFFEMMRRRCIKLRNPLFFPLTAAENTVASVL